MVLKERQSDKKVYDAFNSSVQEREIEREKKGSKRDDCRLRNDD